MRPGGGAEAVFLAESPRLLGLAYRILGSRVDAEDVVQDAWLRWTTADPEDVDRPAAWLTTVTARLALDRLRSAQHRRETYVGPWLPEPIVTRPGPEEMAEQAESLTLAFLCVLEELDPVARVVFLLTDVFGMASPAVAEAVGKSPAACRQIATRARKKLRQSSAAHRPGPTGGDRAVADRFFAAVAAGDQTAALSLLAEDVVLVTDGGPNRHAARRPVVGASRVARFMCNVAKRIPATASLRPLEVNGAAGLRIVDPMNGDDSVVALDVVGEAVTAIWIVSNREKLGLLERPVVIS